MNIPIFCINLERATERKQMIENLWIKNLGFDITFWKATDKNDICIQSVNKKSSYMKREFWPGEIALMDSYIKLLKYILANNINEVIIMEDDVFPNPIFKFINNINLSNIINDYITKCKEEFCDLDILLMHKISSLNSFKIKKEYDFCYELLTFPWGAQMNYYTKNGIILMYESIKDYSYVIDHYHKMPKLKNRIALSKNPFALHYDTNLKPIKSQIR